MKIDNYEESDKAKKKNNIKEGSLAIATLIAQKLSYILGAPILFPLPIQDINENSKEFNMEEWHQVQQRRREILSQTCQKSGIKYIIKRFVYVFISFKDVLSFHLCIF